MARDTDSSGAVPRMVIVPAWGTPDGPWTQIRDAWPGPVTTFWGAGLRGEVVTPGWSLASDVDALVEVIEEGADVLCGAGWAASTVLLAASYRVPRLVVLYSPPLGVDLAGVAERVCGDPKAGRELMSSFGGSDAYWDAAEQATNFTARVDTYLTQRVLDLEADVDCPVLVVAPEVNRFPIPEAWLARAAPPEALHVEALAVLEHE